MVGSARGRSRTILFATRVGFGIAVGSDGNLWFTEPLTSKIGRITPSGTISEFAIPSGAIPDGITAGPDGNLWFTEANATIGRITPSGTITEFPIAFPESSLAGITAGPDGNLWFTEGATISNKIGRITPSGKISVFPIPTAESVPGGITAGPGGTLWFTEQKSNKIGRIEPRLLRTMCVVPKLRGTTLTQAKGLLRREHCKLGKVTEPAKHKQLVVVSQKPAAEKVLPSGAKVSLQLG
jgi:streptogramin lyase